MITNAVPVQVANKLTQENHTTAADSSALQNCAAVPTHEGQKGRNVFLIIDIAVGKDENTSDNGTEERRAWWLEPSNL